MWLHFISRCTSQIQQKRNNEIMKFNQTDEAFQTKSLLRCIQNKLLKTKAYAQQIQHAVPFRWIRQEFDCMTLIRYIVNNNGTKTDS